MKTFLIVLVILLLLGVTIFLLMHKPKKVIDDDLFVKPGADYDIDKNYCENHESDNVENKEEVDEEVDEIKIPDDEIKTHDGEVNIPEHCRIPKDPLDNLPNKYFFNIHEYTSSKGNKIYCIVCSAVIKSLNYRIIVPGSFYPYTSSYTEKVKTKIKSMFNDCMTSEEFLRLDCGKHTSIGHLIKSLDD